MAKYTKTTEVAHVVDPLVTFARDVAQYFEQKNLHYRTLIKIEGEKLQVSKNTPNPACALSNHKILQLSAELQNQTSGRLAELASLLEHIPPLTKNGPDLSLEVRVDHVSQTRLELCYSGISIWQGVRLEDLKAAIYAFIRTHENLDMDEVLEPYRIIISASSTSALRHAQIYADNERNALLRFAACSAEIQRGIKQGTPYFCVKASAPARDPELIKQVTSRTRKAPAPPKNWQIA